MSWALIYESHHVRNYVYAAKLTMRRYLHFQFLGLQAMAVAPNCNPYYYYFFLFYTTSLHVLICQIFFHQDIYDYGESNKRILWTNDTGTQHVMCCHWFHQNMTYLFSPLLYLLHSFIQQASDAIESNTIASFTMIKLFYKPLFMFTYSHINVFRIRCIKNK